MRRQKKQHKKMTPQTIARLLTAMDVTRKFKPDIKNEDRLVRRRAHRGTITASVLSFMHNTLSGIRHSCRHITIPVVLKNLFTWNNPILSSGAGALACIILLVGFGLFITPDNQMPHQMYTAQHHIETGSLGQRPPQEYNKKTVAYSVSVPVDTPSVLSESMPAASQSPEPIVEKYKLSAADTVPAKKNNDTQDYNPNAKRSGLKTQMRSSQKKNNTRMMSAERNNDIASADMTAMTTTSQRIASNKIPLQYSQTDTFALSGNDIKTQSETPHRLKSSAITDYSLYAGSAHINTNTIAPVLKTNENTAAVHTVEIPATKSDTLQSAQEKPPVPVGSQQKKKPVMRTITRRKTISKLKRPKTVNYAHIILTIDNSTTSVSNIYHALSEISGYFYLSEAFTMSTNNDITYIIHVPAAAFQKRVHTLQSLGTTEKSTFSSFDVSARRSTIIKKLSALQNSELDENQRMQLNRLYTSERKDIDEAIPYAVIELTLHTPTQRISRTPIRLFAACILISLGLILLMFLIIGYFHDKKRQNIGV